MGCCGGKRYVGNFLFKPIELNKLEKCTKEMVEEVEKSVLQINPLCKTIQTSFADYKDENLILNKLFNYQNFELAFCKLNKEFSLGIKAFDTLQSVSIQLEGDFIPEKLIIHLLTFS